MKKTPPKHLSTEARRWWRELQTAYGLVDEAGLLLLQTAMESFDLANRAAAQIEADGLIIRDRYTTKAHPAAAILRDARAQMLQALKALNFDLEPLRDSPGRPPGS